MTTYRNYLKAKHPEYLLTGVDNISDGVEPVAIKDFSRKASPLRSLNLFQPFETHHDFIHEVAGVVIYPSIYLITGLIESVIDTARIFSYLLEKLNLSDEDCPIIAFFPITIPATLIFSAFAIVINTLAAVLLATVMLAKSIVGLVTGSLATVLSAADTYLFGEDEKGSNTFLQMN